MVKFSMILISLLSGSALAQVDHPPGPCAQIREACKAAGFVKGGAKNGNGLLRHCVNPILQNQAQVEGATKSLPSIEASLVVACKAKQQKAATGVKN